MKAFISRDLAPESPFRLLLEQAGWEVHGCSLVQLTPLPFAGLPPVEWIFFASSHAVRFFFEQFDLRQQRNPPLRWAAIGPATAATLHNFTGRVDFTGSGEPVATAEAFRAHALNLAVLFPAARNSRQSVPALLGSAIRPHLLAIYDNVPLADPPRRQEDVLVFTSPLNAQSYFSRHSLQPHQRLLAIGQTTAAALRHLGFTHVTVSREPTESSLAQTVLDTTI